MNGHECPAWDKPCRACERAAEARVEARYDEVETVDPWGRTADWNWPRGYGGGS